MTNRAVHPLLWATQTKGKLSGHKLMGMSQQKNLTLQSPTEHIKVISICGRATDVLRIGHLVEIKPLNEII